MWLRKSCPFTTVHLLLICQAATGLLQRNQRLQPHRREGHGRATPTWKWMLLANEPSQQSIGAFQLPVFPLRKTVRFPSERLTLNLYEERYLAMAESILASSRPFPLFGAIYSSDKAQMVRNGKGPIVPLLEEGDIGVIVIVSQSSDDMIPTVGGQRRRRIRLDAQAAARFQIHQVLSDGFAGEEVGNPPFIVSSAFLYLDANDLDRDDASGNSNNISSKTDCHDKLIQKLQASLDTTVPTQDLRLELASFEMAAAFNDDLEVQKRLSMLSLQSVSSRMGLLS